jgi:hypothetical protein
LERMVSAAKAGGEGARGRSGANGVRNGDESAKDGEAKEENAAR